MQTAGLGAMCPRRGQAVAIVGPPLACFGVLCIEVKYVARRYGTGWQTDQLTGMLPPQVAKLGCIASGIAKTMGAGGGLVRPARERGQPKRERCVQRRGGPLARAHGANATICSERRGLSFAILIDLADVVAASGSIVSRTCVEPRRGL
jgi:hypothetical protein